MTDRIVYQLITKGGGMDGRDHTDRGGKLIFATYTKVEAEKNPNKPWCDLKAIVVDVELARRNALAKLDPLDRLVLELKK